MAALANFSAVKTSRADRRKRRDSKAYPAVVQAMPPARIRGRGAASNPEGRLESVRHHAEDDGWQGALLDEAAQRPRTEVTEERARSVITRNDSPDIVFEQAMNPYRGC